MNAHPCPHCGYCPTCGRASLPHAYPFSPYYPWQPYTQPWITYSVTPNNIGVTTISSSTLAAVN